MPLMLLGALGACTNETNFSRQEDDVGVVEGNGELLLEPDTVDLWELVPLITTSETLNIANVGENNLVIYEARIITSGGGTFYLPPEWSSEQRTVAPGQSIDMILAATLAVEGTQEGSLRIKSNDVNLLERYVTLRATTDAPPSETAPPDTGDTRSTGDTGGSTGDTGGPADSGTATDSGA